jgi:thiosulfate/3-mercaptopyruvate sulfurtransferase
VVVAYDDAGGTVAARLVWLLRSTGHQAALLDGGLRTWTGSLTTAVPVRPPARFDPRPWPADLLVATDEVPGLVDHGAVLLDARAAERYRGEVEPVDPRAGHVPGARSLPAASTLAEDGTLLPVAQLRRRLAAVGVVHGADVVASCGSGVTACHTLLVIEHAGLGRGRLFPGSFSAWSADPDRPVSTGDA